MQYLAALILLTRSLFYSTSVGDPLVEQVRKFAFSVKGITFMTTTKQQLIEDLIMHIEQETLSFPEITELINELSIFQYEITQRGTETYSAPSGYHDDCVVALALALAGAKQKTVEFFFV